MTEADARATPYRVRKHEWLHVLRAALRTPILLELENDLLEREHFEPELSPA